MVRKIIKIDTGLCNGCGACASACLEGAIGIVDGKAKLLRDDYCDGLGNCLPACPTGAISFEEREAAAFDEEAVKAKMTQTSEGGCPGSRTAKLKRNMTEAAAASAPSRLGQWPVQIRLVPVRAPYFNGADLLIAADCTAYAYGNFHEDFIKDRIVLIGCPKLDDADYAEKLTEIFRENDIRSVTLARMEVPCCGGLERAAQMALLMSGSNLKLNTVIISTDGKIK